MMEPTVTEVFKEIGERQVSLVLLIAFEVLWSGLWCFDCFSASLSARTTATLRQIQCLRVRVN